MLKGLKKVFDKGEELDGKEKELTFKDKKAFPTLLSRLMGKAFVSSLYALDERIFCHA